MSSNSDFEEFLEEEATSIPYCQWNFNILIPEFSKQLKTTYPACWAFTNFENGNPQSFLETFKIFIYTDGCSNENKGFVSVLFQGKFKDNFQKYNFTCILSIIDNTTESRFRRSFSTVRCLEGYTSNLNTPFGFEKYIKCSTLFNNKDELIPNDKLTICCYIYGPSRDLFIRTCVQDLEECTNIFIADISPEGILRFKLFFNTLFYRCLSKESEYFRLLTETPMQESIAGYTYISEEEWAAFRLLKQLLFRNSVKHIREPIHFLKLYELANKYCILRIKMLCSKYLINNITSTNVLPIFLHANMYNDEDLKRAAIHYIYSNWTEVASTNEWIYLKELNINLFNKVLQHLNARSILLSPTEERHSNVNYIN